MHAHTWLTKPVRHRCTMFSSMQFLQNQSLQKGVSLSSSSNIFCFAFFWLIVVRIWALESNILWINFLVSYLCQIYLLFFFFFFFCYYPIYDCIGLVTVLVFKRRSSTFFLCNLYTFPYSNNCIQWTIFIIYILFFRSQADRPLVFCTMSFTPWKC